MRRQDREVTEIEELLAIIESCKVCRIGIQDEQGLYIVPVNFGYEYVDGRLTLYFHSAREGRKIDALARRQEVCFEMDCEHRLIEGATACKHSFSFKSIIGSGTASFVEEASAKQRALDLLMKHQTGREFEFAAGRADTVAVVKIEARTFTGKYHP